MGWAIAALVFVFLALPEPALAWGPGMHMVTANFILDNLSLLAPGLASLLTENREAFLYGSLSADIFIGKGSRPKRRHSHNWSTGLALLNCSEQPRLRAYALGYMAHLAADVAAHNYYVPNVLYRVKLRGRTTHVYAEMQADRYLTWDRLEAKRLFRSPLHEADFCLLDALNQSRLPFLVKKRVYQGSLYLSGRRVDKSLRYMNRHFPMDLNVDRVVDMQRLSQGLVLDVLNNPTGSVVLNYDPIGSEHLVLVRRSRRRHSPLFQMARSTDPFVVPKDLDRLRLP
ncbi:MAG: zinc dependent phospholipase C family protein [Desulfovibrio sp.]|uniref:zinc dependent phospholipase C family protein n=1 Tax=Desulfovibrio sp. 7SRBS1 TaxID=3378064 RepID=UPI003B420846